eukprot:1185649-Prorocentrum_minimum.AAC.2
MRPGDSHTQAPGLANFEVIGEAGVSVITVQHALERREEPRQAEQGVVARLNNAEGIVAAVRLKFPDASVLINAG